MKKHRLAVISTINTDNKPESALIGIAVSEELDILFDTVTQSRKYRNLILNPCVSLVMGWDNETTLQWEGRARVLMGPEDDKYREIYFKSFPDGKERLKSWPGLVHFRVQPSWIRYSNFNEPQIIEEMIF